MLHTGNFRDIKPDNYDQIWLCVRSLQQMPRNPNNNIFHVPLLSPSKELFFKHLNLKKANQWNKENFDKVFAPGFLQEMLQPEPLDKLQELANLIKTQEILVVCYCGDETLCHRSLIKQIINMINSEDIDTDDAHYEDGLPDNDILDVFDHANVNIQALDEDKNLTPSHVVLKPHQETCRKFIIQHPKCGVFLDVGYGKTLTTLKAIDDLKCRNVLIVAPKAIARTTWHKEVKKWNFNFNCFSMMERIDPKTGEKKELSLKQLIPLYEAICHTAKNTTNLFITSRDRIVHLAQWCLDNDNWPFDMIVCDEFQSFKGGKTKRTDAICTMAEHTYRLIGLTGTPMPNSIEDIWSEIKILDGGKRLGRYITHFRNKYMHSTMVVNGHAVGWKANYGAEEEIFKKIADITISVKTDLHLPPCTINDVPIQLSDEDLQRYKKFASSGIFNLEEIDQFAAFKSGEDYTKIAPANAAVLASKLLQIASGTVYDEHHQVYEVHNQKLAMTQYLVDNTGGPVLIAYHFACDKDRLLNTIKVGPDEKIVWFDGSEKMQDAWNRGDYKVMLLQPASCCHGINLQDGGSTLIWYSIPWSLEHYIQTNGRLYRQGQKNPVVIHRLIAMNTFDVRVANALLTKRFGNDSLLEAVQREIQNLQIT